MKTAAPASPRPRPGHKPAAGDKLGAFLSPLPELIYSAPSLARVGAIYAICGFVVVGLVWSCFAFLDMIAVAPGKIQPAEQTKVIQPVDPGKVVAIHIHNGDRVTAGQVLIELDQTEALSDQAEVVSALNASRAEAARRKTAIAAVRADTLVPPPAIPWDDAIPQDDRAREEQVLKEDLSQLAATVANLIAQRRQTEAGRDKYAANITAQKEMVRITGDRVTMHQQLFDKNFGSRISVIDVQQTMEQAETALVGLEGAYASAVAALAVIDSAIAKARQDVITSNVVALTAAETQIDDLVQKEIKAATKLAHTTLTSPIAGTVQALAVTTLGQVVTASQELMRIVPEGRSLEITAYVLNLDIGFVTEGQPATIKVDAFPFTRYGTISGVVTHTAHDAISAIEAQQNQRDPSRAPSTTLTSLMATERIHDLVFPVTVVPTSTAMVIDGKTVPLSPGMTVSVEIKTGQRRVIDYLLFPLTEQAMTTVTQQ